MKLSGRFLIALSVFNLAMAGSLAAKENKSPSFDEIYSEPVKAITAPPRKSEGTLAAREIPGKPVPPKTAPPRLVKFRDLLRGVAPEDRAEFGGGLRLVNGKVASAHLVPLRKTMDAARVNEILDRLTESPGAEPRDEAGGREKRPDLVVLSKLVEGLSPEARARFYDSLIFKDGELVSFFAGDLRLARSKSDFEAVLRSLGGTNDPKGLCGNGWCNNSECDFPETGLLRCISIEIDGVCKGATCR